MSADVINTYQGEPTKDAAHNQAMLDKADQIIANNDPNRPEWLPEKFKNVEDFVKSYKELETKLHTPKDDPQGNTDGDPKGEPKADPTDDPAKATQEDVSDFLGENGIDYLALSQEYAENGSLSDEAYKSLEKIGIPKYIVDSYIDGQNAITTQIRARAFDIVGGEEEYGAMVRWAQANLSQGEIDSFNASLDTRDPDQAMFAIKGLASQYRSDVGKAPKLVTGDTSGNSAGAFQSLAELTQAMADPRYSKDPAYRQAVSEKLRRSKVL